MKPVSTTFPLLLLIALAVLGLGGCKEDNPAQPPGTELEEIIPNIVTLKLINEASPADSTSASFRDLGETGANPTIDTLRVKGGITYRGTVRALFVGKVGGRDTTIDFTPEYTELGRHHQFFYTMAGASAGRIAVAITDKDSSNLPIGLNTIVAVSSGGTGSGTLRIELGHYDDPAQPKNGTRPPYERDIDVLFPVVIE
jgi:hypothetical protein